MLCAVYVMQVPNVGKSKQFTLCLFNIHVCVVFRCCYDICSCDLGDQVMLISFHLWTATRGEGINNWIVLAWITYTLFQINKYSTLLVTVWHISIQIIIKACHFKVIGWHLSLQNIGACHFFHKREDLNASFTSKIKQNMTKK